MFKIALQSKPIPELNIQTLKEILDSMKVVFHVEGVRQCLWTEATNGASCW
jgi:hypothetical protein